MQIRHSLATIALTATVLGAATAQSTLVVVPAVAASGDAQHSLEYPFGTDGFRFQQVFDVGSITPSFAVIDQIAFRADRLSTPFPGTVIQNVEVWLGNTSVTTATMSTGFAANRTGTQTSVFNGSVTVPALPAVEVGTAPWNIAITLPTPFVYDASQGSLLLEIAAANPPSGPNGHWLDAAEGGGSAVEFGQGGALSGSDNLNLVGHHIGDLLPRRIVPSGTLFVSTTTSFTTYSGALMLGLSNTLIGGAPLLPLDLGVIGATGNRLYLDPIVAVPLAWNSTFIGHDASVQLGIPFDQALIGMPLYAQSGLIDPPANAFGFVTSEALEIVVGEDAPLPARALVSPDHAAPTGTLPDASGDPMRHVGAVVRFIGVFG